MSRSDFSRAGSLHGAVDLGARKQAAENTARRQAAADGTGTAAVIDVTEQNFNAEVVERSLTTPVLLHLTSGRAPQTKQMSPLLEKLAGESGGQWVLAELDVDAAPQIAQALQVQAVPTVYVIVQGRPMPFFQGALPEAELRKALDQLLDQLQEMLPPGGGPEEPAEPQGDRDINEAERALSMGDLTAAAAHYQKALERSPNDPAATTGLAMIEVVRRAQDADPQDVRTRLEANPGDVTAVCRMADLEVLGGQVEAAFDRMLDLVRQTAGDDRETARTHLVSLFEVLPQDDPRVTKARRALARALY